MQSYNLNISGGGEKVTTMFSFGYLGSGGIIIGSSYKRYTARLNTDFNISKRVKAGITVNGAFSKKDNIDSGGDMSAINAKKLSIWPPLLLSHQAPRSYLV